MKKILKEFEETLDAIKKLNDVQESKLNEPNSKGKWVVLRNCRTFILFG